MCRSVPLGHTSFVGVGGRVTWGRDTHAHAQRAWGLSRPPGDRDLAALRENSLPSPPTSPLRDLKAHEAREPDAFLRPICETPPVPKSFRRGGGETHLSGNVWLFVVYIFFLFT